jgi:hypothetical protein
MTEWVVEEPVKPFCLLLSRPVVMLASRAGLSQDEASVRSRPVSRVVFEDRARHV